MKERMKEESHSETKKEEGGYESGKTRPQKKR
jgi:hypothetical protein